MTTGRNRGAAGREHCLPQRETECAELLLRLDQQNAILGYDPITMIIPMNADTLKVVPGISKAIKTPEVDSSAEAKMARGAANVRNSKRREMNTGRIARINTNTRS